MNDQHVLGEKGYTLFTIKIDSRASPGNDCCNENVLKLATPTLAFKTAFIYLDTEATGDWASTNPRSSTTRLLQMWIEILHFCSYCYNYTEDSFDAEKFTLFGIPK